jgi:hypothetical protein
VKTELTLLSKYKEYEDVFSKKKNKIISEKISVTHAIDLEKRARPSYKPIYALSERELRILRDYFTGKKRSVEFDIRNYRLKLLYYSYSSRTVLYGFMSIIVR